MSFSRQPSRVRYRISPSADLLSVTAIDLDGSKEAGHVIDLSAGGIALSFGNQVSVSFKVGEVIWLHMNSPHLASPLVAATQVLRKLECTRGHVYGLRFVDWLGLLSQVPAKLAGVFNQRSNRRVTVDSDRAVEISIEEGLLTSSWNQVFGGLKGVLRNVSSQGLSLRFDCGAEIRTRPAESVKASFTLPGSGESVTFWIEIVRWEADSEGFSCGAVFDTERTEQFTAKRNALVRVLEQRGRLSRTAAAS